MKTIHYNENKLPTVSQDVIKSHPYFEYMEVVQDEMKVSIDYLTVTIHPGYCTDFASIPRIFRWFIDYDDERIKTASIVHDILFNKKVGNRDWAATIMYKLMIRDGIPKWKARIIKRAVSGLIAGRLFEDQDKFDIENGKFANVQINV